MKRNVIRYFSLMLAVAPVATAQMTATLPTTAESMLKTTNSTTAPATLPTSLPSTAPTATDVTLATSGATTAPSRGTTPAGGLSKSKAMTPDYALLTTRSIFMKGHVPLPTTHVTTPLPTTAPTVGRAERNVVFDGVIDADGELTAMFEDTQAGKIIQCKIGDALAGGKISAINLDAITYESAGRTTRVIVGQNLEAGEAPLLTNRATVTDTGSGSSTTAPVLGDPNDMLEKLRAKRKKELGQ